MYAMRIVDDSTPTIPLPDMTMANEVALHALAALEDASSRDLGAEDRPPPLVPFTRPRNVSSSSRPPMDDDCDDYIVCAYSAPSFASTE